MSYGFSATNNYNQILISSDTRNLHFIGKAYLYSTIKASDYYGGMRQWSFRIGTAKNIVPLPFFTMTGEEYYGVSAVRQISAGNSVILTTAPIPIEGQLAKTYNWNSTPTTITEGTDNIYSIITSNVATGTTLYWDISPSTGNDFQYTDGSFIIGATGAGSFQITPTKFFDPYPETAENYTINIRTYTPLTGAVVLSQTIVVNNSTSSDITGFGWTTDANWGPSIIAEGSNNTSSVPPGAFVITATQGNNSVITTSAPITLATEFTETYTFSSLALTMNEGTASTVGITSTNVKDGTVVYWEIPNATNEFLVTSGSFTVTGNAGSFSVTPTSFYDAFAESAETYSIVLKRFDGTNYNTVKTSSQITVVNVANASATTALGWNTDASFGPSSLTEGTVYSGTTPPNVYVVTDANPGNTVYATSFPITIRSQYAETYAFSALTAIVEGTTVAVTITTTNVPNGTVIYWTLNSTNKNNFAVDSGNFTVTANTATFSITPTNVYDAYLESVTDSFTISLSKQFGTQDNLIIETVATSSAITITPASTTQTTGFGWNKNALWGTDPITEGVVASGTPDEIAGTIPANAFVITETNPANTVILTSGTISIDADVINTFFDYYPDKTTNWSGTSYNELAPTASSGMHVLTGYPIGTIIYWSLTTSNTTVDARSTNFKEISGYITIGAPNAALSTVYNYGYITFQYLNTDDYIIVRGADPAVSYPTIYTADGTGGYKKKFILSSRLNSPTGTVLSASNTFATGGYSPGGVYTFRLTGIQTNNPLPIYWTRFSTIYYPWGSPNVIEGTTYTYNVGGTVSLGATWTIIHGTTVDADFSAVSGTVSLSGVFTITPIVDNTRETYQTFRIQVVSNATTILSPVITIAPSIDVSIPGISVPTSIPEGTAFTCTAKTVGLADGVYYWRIDKPTTTGSTIADYTPTSYGTATGDFNTYYGSVTMTNNVGTFTVPALPNNLTNEISETFTISLVTKTTVSRNWSITDVSTNGINDFTAISGTTTPGGFNWSYFTVNAKADSLTEGTETFTISIKDSSNNVLCTSGEISILDVSQTTPVAPYFTGASKITEGTANTYTVYTSGLTNGTYYWRINDVSLANTINQNGTSSDFTSYFGTVTITNNTGTFTVTPASDLNTEFDEQFTISLVGQAASNYRYWSVNPVLPATTADFPVASLSGVCTPGGYNWWYFTVNATADSLTEGTEKFTISIRETSTTGTVKFTSGQINILDVSVTAPVLPYITGPTTVVEGIANTYTVYTTGLTDGTYYWRINDINTSTVPGITPTSTGDFTTSWGTVTITNNTGTFNVAAYADGTLEYDEQFTISLVNKAAADKYWTINHLTTNSSDFSAVSGACTPGGYNWWYFNVNAIADSQTEGTEKFTVQVRQGSTTGTVLTTSGAISITDTSLGNYAVLPASTQEAVNFNVTIFTPSIAAGTTLYWDINHITTSDLDFVTTFGSFVSATAGAVITLSAINYDAAELDEGFTINVRTQPKYIWEIELIRSGVSNTVPEVYIFAQADAAPMSLTETMGLKVLRDDGTPSFDSRLGPLVISAATAVTQPFNPRPTAGGGLNAEECHSNGQAAGDALSPDLTNYNAYNITGIPTKPIYHYTSLAQAQRQTNAHRDRVECFGFYAFGSCQGYEEVQRWNSNYWCFYRGGIKNYGNTQIHAGWIPIIWNCYWDYYANNNLVGFGVGSDGNQGGGWPYNNDTINLSAGVVIVSDGALYD